MTHKLIHTPDYLLVVDDSEIKFKDRYFNEEDGIGLWQDAIPAYHKLNSKKIIAHLPLNDSPILEGVDLLPPLEQEDDVEKIAREEILYNDAKREWWKQGYNKAKEKYKYTKEDMLNAYIEGELSRYKREGEAFLEAQFIQSLSQPKMPVGFECEIEKGAYLDFDAEYKFYEAKKVVFPSEGLCQWVGKYIY